MSIISLTITESTEQIVSGKPKYIIIESNLPSNIYYTLDGSDPNTMSDIYIDKLYLPYEDNTLTVKIFATNGTESSPIIEKKYFHVFPDNMRRSKAITYSNSNSKSVNKFPFGTGEFYPNSQFLDLSNNGQVVYDPTLEVIANAFNANQLPDGYTNKPYNLENYKIKYSTTNSQGISSPGVGTLPAEVLYKLQQGDPEESYADSALFDPKAFVVFVDVDKLNPEDPPIIGNQFFSLERQNTLDGSKLYATGLDAPPVHGSWIRSYHDPRTNIMTSYYRDSVANKWMIIKAPYTPKNVIDSLAGYTLGGANDGRHVYRWIPYMRRILT